MPRGNSGRIVVEIDPALKKELYSVLVREGITLKEWFTRQAKNHIESQMNPPLPFRDSVEDQKDE